MGKMHEQIMRQVDAKAFNTIKVVVEEVLLECAPVNVLAVAFMKLFVVSGQALHEEWHYTMQHWSSETTGVEFFVGLGVLGAVMLSLSLNIGEDVLFDDRVEYVFPPATQNWELAMRRILTLVMRFGILLPNVGVALFGLVFAFWFAESYSLLVCVCFVSCAFETYFACKHPWTRKRLRLRVIDDGLALSDLQKAFIQDARHTSGRLGCPPDQSANELLAREKIPPHLKKKLSPLMRSVRWRLMNSKSCELVVREARDINERELIDRTVTQDLMSKARAVLQPIAIFGIGMLANHLVSKYMNQRRELARGDQVRSLQARLALLDNGAISEEGSDEDLDNVSEVDVPVPPRLEEETKEMDPVPSTSTLPFFSIKNLPHPSLTSLNFLRRRPRSSSDG